MARLKSVAYPRPLSADARRDWQVAKEELAEVCERPAERCKLWLCLVCEDDVSVSGWGAPILRAQKAGKREYAGYVHFSYHPLVPMHSQALPTFTHPVLLAVMRARQQAFVLRQVAWRLKWPCSSSTPSWISSKRWEDAGSCTKLRFLQTLGSRWTWRCP